MALGTIIKTNYSLKEVGIDPKLFQKQLEQTYTTELMKSAESYLPEDTLGKKEKKK